MDPLLETCRSVPVYQTQELIRPTLNNPQVMMDKAGTATQVYRLTGKCTKFVHPRNKKYHQTNNAGKSKADSETLHAKFGSKYHNYYKFASIYNISSAENSRFNPSCLMFHSGELQCSPSVRSSSREEPC